MYIPMARVFLPNNTPRLFLLRILKLKKSQTPIVLRLMLTSTMDVIDPSQGHMTMKALRINMMMGQGHMILSGRTKT